MRLAIFLISFLLAGAAAAEPTELAVPSQKLVIRFDGPALTKVREDAGPARYSYAGTAGKINVSVFVEPPDCEGGSGNEARYKCFLQKLKTVPGLAPATIRGNEVPSGVQVAYLTQAEVDGRMVQMFHVNLLFLHAGKFGDLHVSVVQPERADIPALFGLVRSAQVSELNSQ